MNQSEIRTNLENGVMSLVKAAETGGLETNSHTVFMSVRQN